MKYMYATILLIGFTQAQDTPQDNPIQVPATSAQSLPQAPSYDPVRMKEIEDMIQSVLLPG